jgi:hypothetical protein
VDELFPFRPQALAVYRGGLTDSAARSPLRATRWPLAALVVLLLACLAFAGTVRLPRAVTGTVIGTDGAHLVAVFPGRVTPAGDATIGRTTLRVVGVTGDDRRVPPQVPRPVTVVLLTGPPDLVLGPVNLRVGAPTLFEMLTGGLR